MGIFRGSYLIPYVRAELALKLEELFQKKAKENNVTKSHSFEHLSINERLPCQNSDNPIGDFKENPSIYTHEDAEDEQPPTYYPKTSKR